MNSVKAAIVLLAIMVTAPLAHAGDKKGYHCEVKKDGKHVDLEDVKNRKDCKAKGGKWVKDHDHDHSEEGADHEHED